MLVTLQRHMHAPTHRMQDHVAVGAHDRLLVDNRTGYHVALVILLQ